MSEFINCDCLEALKKYPDKYFNLAIVDPPYGDAGGGFANKERFGQRFDRYRVQEYEDAHTRKWGKVEHRQKNHIVGRSAGARVF